MKKFGSILLTLAVLLTLCAGVLPVYAEDASITLTPYRTILVVGQSASLSITTTSTVTDVTVVSSDTSVLTYNSTYKTLTGVGKGTAIITATGTDSDTNKTVTASVTIVVCDSTGLLTSTDYYIMNYSTGDLLSLSAQSDANSVNIDSRARDTSPLSQWTAIINSDGTIRLQSVYSNTGRSAYVSGTNLILYNSTGARTKLTIFRVETGRYQGLYQIQYNGQYLYMSSSGDVYFSSVLGNGAYWSFMEVQKGYADMYGFYVPDSHEDAIDTTCNLAIFASVFNSLGYVADGWENETAAYAYELLPDDDICIINSHANTGIIYFFGDNGINNGNITVNLTVANDHLASNNYYIQSINVSGLAYDNALASSRLIMYMGCLTGVDHTHDFVEYIKTYNLVNATFDKGAHCVIGLDLSVDERDMNTWLGSFIGAINNGMNISEAIYHADEDTTEIRIKYLDETTDTVNTMPLVIAGDTCQYLD